MKKIILLSAVAVLGFAGSKATAAGTSLILNVSGTAVFQKTEGSVVGNVSKSTTSTMAINNKVVYNLISNAVANAENGIATTLPANGWIVYVPVSTDAGGVNGFFYATNKLGDSALLSGLDAFSDYYSFIELDTDNDVLGISGYGDPFESVFTDSINTISGNGSESDTSTAVLYIHDNPYVYDAADNPNVVFDNDNAIEIRGVLKLNVTYKAEEVVSGSGTLTGTGNVMLNDNEGVLTSGRASF